jgi:hypothetical protein
MTHPNLKRSWIEWEFSPNGPAPVVVIETDLSLEPGPNGIDSSTLDDMIDEALAAHSSPNFKPQKARIVPAGKHNA